jgi:hypothetical protein
LARHSNNPKGLRVFLVADFTDCSDEVTAQCYLHGNDYAPQGWYARNDRVIKLPRPQDGRHRS